MSGRLAAKSFTQNRVYLSQCISLLSDESRRESRSLLCEPLETCIKPARSALTQKQRRLNSLDLAIDFLPLPLSGSGYRNLASSHRPSFRGGEGKGRAVVEESGETRERVVKTEALRAGSTQVERTLSWSRETGPPNQ